ncbi:hypothetical protein ACWEGQ_15030 [Streptomyces seoulensis]
MLVSSYVPGELEPLLDDFGWDLLPPMVPLPRTRGRALPADR